MTRLPMIGTICILFVLFSWLPSASPRSTGLSVLSQCICSGYRATYECQVSGQGSTVWKGSAFSNCLGNRIILRHSQFSSGGVSVTCNSGAIIGSNVRVENNDCFVSQLEVFINSDIIGSTIICSYDNGRNEVDVGNSTVILTQDPLPPPLNVTLTNATASELTFNWNPVPTNCQAVKYNINPQNCGTCPTTSNESTVICINPQPQPNAGVTCTFSVQTEVCENIIGGDSNLVTATLKVPDIPIITVVPTYSQSEQKLTNISVSIIQQAPFSITSGISGSVTSYNITYSNSTTGESCDSTVIPASACNQDQGVCRSLMSISSLKCPRSVGLSVTVFATNILGDGGTSEEIIIDDINRFVNLNYNTTTKSIICTFVDKQDLSEKSCAITFGKCQEQQTSSVEKNSTSTEIVLALHDLEETAYCYTAVVSNSTFTVNIINGKIDLSDSIPKVNTAGAIAGGIIGTFVVAAIIVVLIIIVISSVNRRRKPEDRECDCDDPDSSESESLIPVKSGRFKVLKVDRDCELATFIRQQNLKFQKGAVFYEFTRAEEDINLEKEVILMYKKTKKFYTGKKACSMIGAPGEKVKNPKLVDYKVFVQSMGIGCRPLKAESSILYDLKCVKVSRPQMDLTKVDINRFQKLEVDEGCELREFIEGRGLPFKPGCAFFEFKNAKEDIDEKREVILMDEETGDLYTGPAALTMIGAPGRDIERPVLNKRRVFVQSLFNGSRFIHGESLLLYEDPGPIGEDLEAVKSNRFQIFEVKENCSLRSYVEKECSLEYNARRFFFEFVTREEEITDDKEIILMDKETKKMFTGLKAKEMIEAPNKVVKMPRLEKYKVFVQNGGGGARCVKKGTMLLYEVEYIF